MLYHATHGFVSTEPQTGFHIAFNMFDTDGNERVDKQEFLVVGHTATVMLVVGHTGAVMAGPLVVRHIPLIVGTNFASCRQIPLEVPSLVV